MSSFNSIAEDIWQTCEEKGFHEPIDPELLLKGLRLMLIVGEVSEAMEAIRKGDVEHHNEEVADVAIRLLHYAHCEGIDLDAEVQRKMETNAGRPYKHGKKF